MKKKLLSFIFAICLIIPCAVILGACGAKEKDPTKPEEPTTSVGLEYELINNGTEYAVKSVGTYTNNANIDIPSMHNEKSVTVIKEQAFKNCDNLEGVTIPTSITTIENQAFYDCDALQSINISNGVVTIGERAFESCDMLTSVVFGSNVETIGNYAFSSCDALQSVLIPEKVTSIGNQAFYDCETLTSVTIGNGVETIGMSAFYDCDSLETVILGSSIETIGAAAFYSCIDLTTIIIPNSVTTIGDSAFRYSALNIAIIDSESISNNLVEEDSQGELALCSNTIYVKIDLRVTNSTYLLENFTKQATSDKAGYDMYVRNAE